MVNHMEEIDPELEIMNQETAAQPYRPNLFKVFWTWLKIKWKKR
jgi:hypothetical protein